MGDPSFRVCLQPAGHLNERFQRPIEKKGQLGGESGKGSRIRDLTVLAGAKTKKCGTYPT